MRSRSINIEANDVKKWGTLIVSDENSSWGFVRTVGSEALCGGYTLGWVQVQRGCRNHVRSLGQMVLPLRGQGTHFLLFSRLSNTCDKGLSVGGTNSNCQRLAGVQQLLSKSGTTHSAVEHHRAVLGGCGKMNRPNLPLAILVGWTMGLTGLWRQR